MSEAIVEVVESDGRLRVRPIAGQQDFDHRLFVQFPEELRIKGARYSCTLHLVVSKNGAKHYRVDAGTKPRLTNGAALALARSQVLNKPSPVDDAAQSAVDDAIEAMMSKALKGGG